MSNKQACANCGEPWGTADHHYFGEMYDGEWCCSTWCEDSHEREGCPMEQSDGDGEMLRRRARRRAGLLERHEPDCVNGYVHEDGEVSLCWSCSPLRVGGRVDRKPTP